MKNNLSLKCNINTKISICKSYDRIRTFVLRERKLTRNQLNAVNSHWSDIVIQFQPKLINFSKLFGSDKLVIMEIGFGNGNSLVQMAQNNSQQNFLGIEVYLPGIANCLVELKKTDIKNLRLIYCDVRDVLENMIPDNSLHKIQLFFPDPWPKNCHHKRRLVNTSFANLARQKLKDSGSLLHIVTDCKNYASYIVKTIDSINNHKNQSLYSQDDIMLSKDRPITKFEQRSNLLGHKIYELIFRTIK
ncbi:tRNA (guanosine(46)-N7)-methyltransferase TrmB [Candidatus Pantoea edessiphila]|uniref:tRNA (guanine-N(7)-)-methyltransferase n=1 Tax=Candidatus Pantoea edessiphila TaxID=2044610 RepID=A0A2P5SXS8_9GAMM|nr:tRNA (guanosine(46)-N7)-methyltransferase TrmB [Candidatus Pantoea edessiphila]MBK4775752.1 tRNA (guanosine(46)-N7)-methyltransferase TrmB [Pantoea sp. Edef]PPI87148.1 tRNA (guanosine(46)-N7)-methyltransferase TrmB [Candidatus Pantoea edessiphila]